MPDIEFIRGEIERMRLQVHRQRGEIRQLQRTDVVLLAKHVPVAAARDPWRDLDIPPYLDRRGKAPAEMRLPNRGNS